MTAERTLHAVPAADGLPGEAAVVERDWSTEPVGSPVAVTLRVTDPSGAQASVPLGREAARLLACGLLAPDASRGERS